MDKLHTLCYSSHYDAAAMQQYVFKVFTAEVLDDLLELFEVLSTLKPVYDTQRGLFQDKSSIFTLFIQMFNILIYEGRNQQYSKGVDSFEARFRAACNNLAEVFADSVGQEQEDKDLAIKYVDLLGLMKAEHDKSLPEGAKNNSSLKNVAAINNFRGYLIANVLIVGQYITVFEGTRKSTQESLCVAKEWSRELKILSCFMTAFNECNHKITDMFFQDQAALIKEGIVTQPQIDKISTLYTHQMTGEDKATFSEARKKIEENIDLHRENLTYMDQEYININRLLHIVWEFWRQNRRGHSIDEQIIRNKKAYTSLTISNIKDINKVIAQFEMLDGDFNSTQFLTTISRLFTYISELQQLIQNEKMSGITFYQFVEQGCLAQLIKIFNIIKKLEIKQRSLETDPAKQIRFIAVDCIQSINKQLKNVLTHFINCSQVLTSAFTPSMPDLIKEDGVYDSTQHFFANYVHQMLEQLFGLKDLRASLSLYQDKDLRKIQVLLIQNIASGFEKCKFLKDEFGEPFAGKRKPDSGRDAPGKPKKLHRDESLIEQITCMGFDRKSAKKALKLTGDVSNAVTFLLESGEAGLEQVSVSEEEDPAKAEQAKKDAEEQAKKEEEERALKEEQQREKRDALISTADFKLYLAEAQETGLDIVTEWCCLTPEMAKLVSLKTQRKYAKIYDQYVQTLFKSPDKKDSDLVKILDAIMGKYSKLTNFLHATAGSEMELENMSVMVQDTKTQLNLVNKLISQPCFESLDKQSKKERNNKLKDNVVKTLRAIVGSADN